MVAVVAVVAVVVYGFGASGFLGGALTLGTMTTRKSVFLMLYSAKDCSLFMSNFPWQTSLVTAGSNPLSSWSFAFTS